MSQIIMCAFDAVYQKCYKNFTSRNNIPRDFVGPDKKSYKGVCQPEKNPLQRFRRLLITFENNDSEHLTLQKLVNLMESEFDPNTAYSSFWVKKKLEEYLGDDILFTKVGWEAQNVITIQRRASSSLSSFYKMTHKADEKTRVALLIKTAGQLILEEIKTMPKDPTYYPDIVSTESASAKSQLG